MTGSARREGRYDAVVLGGGTAGRRVGAELARAGRSVALVESRLVGGDCPYFACMPSKSMLQSARRGETWEHAVARRDEVTGHRADRTAEAGMLEAGVTVLRGHGRILGPGVIDVAGSEIAYTDLVICTGSAPAVPDLDGIADVPVWTSDEALTRPDLPRRLVVLGGGPVGCELAQVYAAFGSQVTLVEPAIRLLPDEAPFAGDMLADALRRMGADIRLGARPVRAERADPGLRLRMSDGTVIRADRVLAAGPRRPRVHDLGLEALGLDVDTGSPGAVSDAGTAGRLRVDGTCRVTGTTGAGRVWAAGDVTGATPYTHTAGYQARIVVANLLGKRRTADYRAIPRAVGTTPSVYAVGRRMPDSATAGGDTGNGTGDDLLAAGLDLIGTARAAIEDDDRGRVELYADRSRGVLAGAAAVGLYAEEWMSEIALAIRAEIPLSVLADVVHAFPTYGEAIEPPLRELAERL